MNIRHLAIGATVALVLGTLLLWVTSAYTQSGSSPRLASPGGVPVPHLINYQGRLTDRLGRPRDGTHFMRSCIYDVASGGTALWCDPPTPGTWRSVEVKQGVFSVLLGDEGETNPIPSTVFDEASSDRWLGVQISPDTQEMTPRRRIVSVGYAYRAEDANRAQDADNADTVDGLHASSTPASGTLFPLDASSKFPNSVLYTGHGNGLDADMVDGLHASEISTAVEDKRNLAIKVNATSPASQIDIDADYLTIENAGLAAVDLTADITVSGANGLDTGAEAPGTWYSIWVIHGSSGTASLLSTSASSPIMPSGYTKKRRVGWVYNESNGDFRKFHHRGDWWYYDAEQSALSGGMATIFTDVDLSSLIPSTAKAVCLYYQFQGDGRGMTFWLRPDGTNWTLPIENVKYGDPIAGISMYEQGQTEIPVTNQIIEYKSDGGYGIDSVDLSVKGYYDP